MSEVARVWVGLCLLLLEWVVFIVVVLSSDAKDRRIRREYECPPVWGAGPDRVRTWCSNCGERFDGSPTDLRIWRQLHGYPTCGPPTTVVQDMRF